MIRDKYLKYFENKKITCIGLGLLGRGVTDAEFLAKWTNDIIITDAKDKISLAPSLLKLASYPHIKYTLGGHDEEDFKNRDMILKSAGIPIDFKYLDKSLIGDAEVFMSAAKVVQIAKENLINLKVIGVTGTRGKSTTTKLIYHIISEHIKNNPTSLKKASKIYLGGNIRGATNLPLLDVIEDNDYLVLELDSWQLQGFNYLQISPDISVFTNIMSDHMNYYNNDMDKYFYDKANIFKYQKSLNNNYLITNQEIKNKIVSEKINVNLDENNIIVPANINYVSNLLGAHNQVLIACAHKACSLLNISDEEIFKYIKSFKAEEGRLEYLGEFGEKRIKIINDNNATTPDATIAGIKAVRDKWDKRIVMLTGGRSKGLDSTDLVKEIISNAKYVVLLAGTGTDELVKLLVNNNFVNYKIYNTLSECVDAVFVAGEQGDVALFSPAFASFSHEFNNEYERNDEFVRCIKLYA